MCHADLLFGRGASSRISLRKAPGNASLGRRGAQRGWKQPSWNRGASIAVLITNESYPSTYGGPQLIVAKSRARACVAGCLAAWLPPTTTTLADKTSRWFAIHVSGHKRGSRRKLNPKGRHLRPTGTIPELAREAKPIRKTEERQAKVREQKQRLPKKNLFLNGV